MAKSKGQKEGAGVPYCTNRKLQRERRRAHSDGDKMKPKSIVEFTLKTEQPRIKVANARYRELEAQGKVTKRKRDGSYYILGGP